MNDTIFTNSQAKYKNEAGLANFALSVHKLLQ